MKVVDRFVVVYAGLLAVYTIVFRWLLAGGLDQQRYLVVWGAAAGYALLVGITAWKLGAAHSAGNFFFDIGIAFHSATYLVWGIVSELWFLTGMASPRESAVVVHGTLLVWGVFYAMHLALYARLRGKTIHGIAKHDIFG